MTSTPAVSERLALFLLFSVPAVWSVNYLVARWAPGLISPHVLAFSRWICAALILTVFAWKEIIEKRHLIFKDMWQYFVLGALGMGICGAWLYIGGRSTSATNIGLIYALSPVFIVMASSYLLGERLKVLQWLGIALALLGLVHVVIKGHWGVLANLQFSQGDAWVLVCAVAWAVYSIFLKRWESPFSPLARLVLTALAGCILMLPFVLLELAFGKHWPAQIGQTVWNLKTLGLILMSAVFPGAGAYWMYSVAQRTLGAARTSMALYLGPVYGGLLAWALLGEPVHMYHLIGAGFIFAGIALVTGLCGGSVGKK